MLEVVQVSGRAMTELLARVACHARQSLACDWQRSLPGAGLVEQLPQIGLSQVPPWTFQSQSSGAGDPHSHLGRDRREVQTMAPPPPGSVTWVQGISADQE